MSAHEAIRKAVSSVVTDTNQAAKISDAVFIALDNGGWFTTDNDHLAMLRATLQVIHTATMNPDTPARELSPLTRRLQDLSREVTTLEERQRQERGERGNSGRTGTGKGSVSDSGSAGSFDPTKV
jgi:hypothetical protein